MRLTLTDRLDRRQSRKAQVVPAQRLHDLWSPLSSTAVLHDVFVHSDNQISPGETETVLTVSGVCCLSSHFFRCEEQKCLSGPGAILL